MEAPRSLFLEEIKSQLSVCVRERERPCFIRIEKGHMIGNSYSEGVYRGKFCFWGTWGLYWREVENEAFKEKLQIKIWWNCIFRVRKKSQEIINFHNLTNSTKSRCYIISNFPFLVLLFFFFCFFFLFAVYEFSLFCKIIYLFIYFSLRSVFVAAHGAEATLGCSAQASHCSGFSCCGARALGTRASVVVAHRLSSCGTRA